MNTQIKLEKLQLQNFLREITGEDMYILYSIVDGVTRAARQPSPGFLVALCHQDIGHGYVLKPFVMYFWLRGDQSETSRDAIVSQHLCHTPVL